MEMTYVCSPLSAPSRAERLANAAKATTYMIWAEKEFGGRAVAPHAYLPYLLDDSVPEQRALALDFGLKLLGTEISSLCSLLGPCTESPCLCGDSLAMQLTNLGIEPHLRCGRGA